MAPKKAKFRIGTSGYQYDHWKGIFYPAEIRKSEWFRYYAEHFDTVEINNTFYQLPSAETFDAWREQAPPGFLYVLKYSRYATHFSKLTNPRDSLGKFLARADRLREFLGPILVQLPPGWRLNASRLDEFLLAAPADHRWAIEFRDPSWLCEAVYSTLWKHSAALCVHDLIKNHPRRQTADWTYIRFHGDQNHAGKYTRQRLLTEAAAIRDYLERGLDVFVYFNNDVHGYAVENAADLRRFVSH